MTRILIVEDDPGQSKLLARAITQRKPDYTVFTAPNGQHAISLLEREAVDLVLTDLQMCDMDGFALLGWLSNHRPSVLAFSMTAYGTEETEKRLDALGSIACFTKPLDVASLVRRLSQGLSENVRGHVQNVSLASFLQLMEMEQKTCTLTVQSEQRIGTLFLRKGELLDARIGDLDGEAAAFTILAWAHPGITIDAVCKVGERRIQHSINWLLMEAMRRHDEDARESRRAPAHPELTPIAFVPVSPAPVAPPAVSQPSLPAPPKVTLPPGVFAALSIELPSGRVLAGQGTAELDVHALAAAAAELVQHELRVFGAVEELVFYIPNRSELIRLAPGDDRRCALLLFDPSEITLGMARVELDVFVREHA